ncbi:hypothetical protein AAF712_012952 [Marasmius tenuissimus]|uniref:Uncharacterized protein n=1 Tax=Marasmius tenuissimus TaxID=585030 RepID=A0ABR2ZFD8_9AGAR
MSGLASTLIIVPVTYNKAIQSVQQVTSNLQFQEPGTQESVAEREIIALRTSRLADNELGKTV